MNPTTGPAVGETWAYRARSVDPLVQVFVMRIGSKRPVRVLIRFVDAESEGRDRRGVALRVDQPDVRLHRAPPTL